MTDRRSIYFPLRANAAGLLAGAPFERFRERLKVSAPLYDHMILHEGTWIGIAGPTLNYQMHLPRDQAPEEVRRPQTAAARHAATGGHVQLLTSLDETSEPKHLIGETDARLHWQASFEPIRDELPHAYSWIEFENYTLTLQTEKIANQLAAGMQDEPLLRSRFDEPFTQALVAKNAGYCFVLGGVMRAAISIDRLHSHVLAALIARGQAAPVLGDRALTAVIPDVRRFSWEDVEEARRLPGLPRLRGVLGEVEAHALAGGNFVQKQCGISTISTDLRPRRWPRIGRGLAARSSSQRSFRAPPFPSRVPPVSRLGSPLGQPSKSVDTCTDTQSRRTPGCPPLITFPRWLPTRDGHAGDGSVLADRLYGCS